MMHILVILFALISTGSAAIESRLHVEMMGVPYAEKERFYEALEKFLRRRAAEPRPVPMKYFVERIARFSRSAAEMSRVFQILGAADSGLSAAEVAEIMMSHHMEEATFQGRATRAFQRLVGSTLPLAAGQVSKRQMEIFAELANFTVDFEDWEQLAAMPGDHVDVRPLVSAAMVVKQLDRLRDHKLLVRHWRTILSYYEPDFDDSKEMAKILSCFDDYTRMRMAVEGVRNWRTRAEFQERILRRVLRPSHGTVRTILAPLGAFTPPAYLAHLDRLMERYLARARATDCEHLVLVWSTSIPVQKPATGRPVETPAHWRVIDNPARSSP